MSAVFNGVLQISPSSAIEGLLYDKATQTGDLDRMRPQDRDYVQLMLETLGQTAGRMSRMRTGLRRDGDLAGFGNRRDDFARAREKEEVWKRFLENLERLAAYFSSVALKLALTEMATHVAIRQLTQVEKILEDSAAETICTGGTHFSRKQALRAIRRQKEDLEEFRDRDLRALRRTMEATKPPPSETQIQSVEQSIDQKLQQSSVLRRSYAFVTRSASHVVNLYNKRMSDIAARRQSYTQGFMSCAPGFAHHASTPANDSGLMQQIIADAVGQDSNQPEAGFGASEAGSAYNPLPEND